MRRIPLSGNRFKIGGAGCIRGGTTWFSWWLLMLGIRTGHEVLDMEGMIDGYNYMLHPHWFERHGDVVPQHASQTYEVFVHLWRHPLDSSESLFDYTKDKYRLGSDDWDNDNSARAQMMRVWVEAHKRADRLAFDQQQKGAKLFRVRICHLDEDLPPLAEFLGKTKEAERVKAREKETPGNRAHAIPKNRNPRMSWLEWARLDPEYFVKGAEFVGKHQLKAALGQDVL